MRGRPKCQDLGSGYFITSDRQSSAQKASPSSPSGREAREKERMQSARVSPHTHTHKTTERVRICFPPVLRFSLSLLMPLHRRSKRLRRQDRDCRKGETIKLLVKKERARKNTETRKRERETKSSAKKDEEMPAQTHTQTQTEQTGLPSTVLLVKSLIKLPERRRESEDKVWGKWMDGAKRKTAAHPQIQTHMDQGIKRMDGSGDGRSHIDRSSQADTTPAFHQPFSWSCVSCVSI